MKDVTMNLISTLAAATLALAPVSALAGPVVLVLSNHHFETPQIVAPAGERIRIELRNQDSSADEFDSSDLKVEEDVTPHGVTVFDIGPLKPGTYHFMGEAHPKTAQGVIIVN